MALDPWKSMDDPTSTALGGESHTRFSKSSLSTPQLKHQFEQCVDSRFVAKCGIFNSDYILQHYF